VQSVPDPHSPLRLNVGFIVHQSIGYFRDFPFDIPKVRLHPDPILTDLNGTVRVSRTPQGLLMQVKLHAWIETECVRCLDLFEQELHTDFSELYAFTHRSTTESNLILPEDGHIDLEPILREYMLLEVPISPLCRQDCKGLCPVCGENLNRVQCDHNTEPDDPRLAVLKNMLHNK